MTSRRLHMLIIQYSSAGTNPIHNKKPKKAAKGEEDDEDKAFKLKQAAGMTLVPAETPARRS